MVECQSVHYPGRALGGPCNSLLRPIVSVVVIHCWGDVLIYVKNKKQVFKWVTVKYIQVLPFCTDIHIHPDIE